jgi:uncharacterized membrane protein
MHPSRQIGKLGTAARVALGGVFLTVPFAVGDAPAWLHAALGLVALLAARHRALRGRDLRSMAG